LRRASLDYGLQGGRVTSLGTHHSSSGRFDEAIRCGQVLAAWLLRILWASMFLKGKSQYIGALPGLSHLVLSVE
jgi:hypothetical protein